MKKFVQDESVRQCLLLQKKKKKKVYKQDIQKWDEILLLYEFKLRIVDYRTYPDIVMWWTVLIEINFNM